MRSDYLEARAEMMQAWADWLDGASFPRKSDATAKALKEANLLIFKDYFSTSLFPSASQSISPLKSLRA